MRFSKEKMQSYIVKRMMDLENIWEFDPRDGYSQVIGSDVSRIIAYGEYQTLENLYTNIAHNNIGEE